MSNQQNGSENSTTKLSTGVQKIDKSVLDSNQFTLIGYNSVIELGSDDFLLDTDEKILLKWKDCLIILFYSENEESKQLARVFSSAAQQTIGKNFAACNLKVHQNLAKAFMSLDGQDSIMRAFRLKQVPFILVYREGRPQAYYNGDRDTQALVDYSLTLACNFGYVEMIQLPASSTVDKNIQMSPWTEYKDKRTNSTQYTTDKPIRQFDPNTPVTAVGSQAAAGEVQQEVKQRQAEAAGRLTPAEVQAGITQPTDLQSMLPPLTPQTQAQIQNQASRVPTGPLINFSSNPSNNQPSPFSAIRS